MNRVVWGEWRVRIVFKMADGEENTSGKQCFSIMFLHHKSVLPGLMQCDLLVLLCTLLLANIFTLARLQFERRVNRPVPFFCLAQRSSPMVKFLVKLADMAINRHNNM